MRHSPHFGAFHQQLARFRGASGAWGSHDGPYGQHSRYGYHQREYPQNLMHRPPPYEHYPGANYGPRGGYGPGWQQQPPIHRPPYDNYSRSGLEGLAGPRGHPAAPNMGPGQNHNYGYPSQYPHAAPPPSSYGHEYDETKYGTQAPVEHPYGGQGNAQQPYVQSYPGYAPNQQYVKPTPYSMPNPAQPAAPQAYAGPRPVQPEAPYQAGNPATVQPYSQQPAQYPTYPTADSYGQQQQAAAPYGQQTPSGYAQPVSQPAVYMQPATSGYAQPVAQQATSTYVQQAASGYAQSMAHQAPGAYVQQATPGYAQPAAQQTPSSYGSQGMLPGSYTSYPTSQPGYADQSSTISTVYTYQTATTVPDPNAAYSAQQSSQLGYARPQPQSQPQPAQATTYDQSAAK